VKEKRKGTASAVPLQMVEVAALAAEVKAWLFQRLNGETESLISQRYEKPSSLSRRYEVARKFNSGD
jgi:hypothetical protein